MTRTKLNNTYGIALMLMDSFIILRDQEKSKIKRYSHFTKHKVIPNKVLTTVPSIVSPQAF